MGKRFPGANPTVVKDFMAGIRKLQGCRGVCWLDVRMLPFPAALQELVDTVASNSARGKGYADWLSLCFLGRLRTSCKPEATSLFQI